MKADYKNWVPKGMLITMAIINVLLLFSVLLEDEAFEVVRGYVFNHANRARKVYDKLMKMSFNEEAGFERKDIMPSGGLWRVDMTKCPYNDVLKSYGCDRLCTLF